MRQGLWRCAALVLAFGLVTALPAVALAEKPRIEDTRVERAPIDAKGGLMNPVAWCPSGRDPRVRTVVAGIGNDFHAVWRYRGSLPGLYFPRVEVGRYEVRTRAWCGKRRAVREETVRVREKTHRTTVSRAEFRRIKRGMSRAEVRAIVGYDGTGSRYGKRMWRTYEMMAFWSIATVSFREGQVVRKDWDVDHD